MELTTEQYEKISKYFPVQRGNVKTDNLTVLNALLYVLENGCKWRALPERFGNWGTIYKRLNRWCRAGVLKRIFEGLLKEKICHVEIEFVALDSSCSKVHPNGCGALKKTDHNLLAKQRVDGTPSFMWFPQMTKQLSA